jgi:hypothetical protein
MAGSVKPGDAGKLQVVTLNTGHSMMSDRAEVEDRVISVIRAALARGAALPEGATMRDHVAAGALGIGGWSVVRLTLAIGGWWFEVFRFGHGCSFCWVCDEASESDGVWGETSRFIPIDVEIARPGHTPWLAAALLQMPVMPGDPLGAFELADVERSIAWTMLTGD